ncbi:UDP-glucose 4-epimerase [compost metagenome]
MRVLITGGYGFIGSFVSEKFHREGHEVVIVDNMSSGNVKNINCQHTSYIIDVESPACDAIFVQHEIDVVIHLAAQINIVTSMENPYADTKSNILGLTNILQLSVKHRVKRFIFASSAAVYGMAEDIPLSESQSCKPVSPYGINKLLGEYYCDKWSELYGLNTLCLRFANVYGPRQGSVGEGGVISTFMERISTGQDLHVYGSGEQTRDFIYVEDIANAIYTASHSSQTGIMNLSTRTESSVNSLIDVLSKLHSYVGVARKEPRPGDIFRSVLDNTLIRTTLNWEPQFSLEQGLSKTYEWFTQAGQAGPKLSKPAEEHSSRLNDEHIQNELITSSLSRHIRSLYLSQSEHYVEGTPVLKPDIFAAVILSRELAKKKYNTDYTLLSLKNIFDQNDERLHEVSDMLRETDYIGINESDHLQILLSNVTSADAPNVVDRLNRLTITAEINTSSDLRKEAQI